MADDPDPDPAEYACFTCTWAGDAPLLDLLGVRCPRCGGECYPCEEPEERTAEWPVIVAEKKES